MKFQKLLFAILLVLISNAFTFAQNFIGIVNDQEGRVLAGATIVADNAVLLTNSKGVFLINKKPNEVVSLKISMLGFQPLVQQIKDEKELTFQLKSSIKDVEQVLVSAQKLQENSAATYDNIQQKDIAKNNLGQDLPYLLNQIPSTVITSDAGTGIGYTGIRIRGSDATRTNVTINGIPLNDAESQGTFLVNLPDLASSIDNMQIQRGVGSSTNGAGAFGASINIQTEKINDTAGAEITRGVGSFGTKRLVGKFSTGQLKNNWSFSGRASTIESKGYIDNSAAKLNSYFATANYVGKKSILKLNYISGAEKTFLAWEGVPTDSIKTNRTFNPIAESYKDQYDSYTQSHYQLFYTRIINSHSSYNFGLHVTKGKGFFQEFKFDQAFSSIGFDTLFTGQDTINSTNLLRRRWLDNTFKGFVFSYQNRINEKLNLQIGASANTYNGNHFAEVVWAQFASQSLPNHHIFDGTGLKKEANVYFKLDYQLKHNLNAFVDLQTRAIRYQLGGANINLIDVSQKHRYLFFNPKIGLSFSPTIHDVLYLSYSIANKEPNRDDLIGNLYRTQKAKSENLADLELGWKYQDNRLNSALNLFYMNYRDQLIPTGRLNDVGESIRENCAKSFRLGIEWSSVWAVSTRFNIAANIALSANKIKEYTEVLYDYDANTFAVIDTIEQKFQKSNIAYSPNVILGAAFTYRLTNQIGLSLQNKYVGKQYLDNTSSTDKMIKAFLVNDLILNYQKPLRNNTTLAIDFKVANVLNRKYVANGYTYSYLVGGEKTTAVYYYPQATRSILLALSLRF